MAGSVGKIVRKNADFQNVVASGTATANFVPGRTIERIVLELGGTSFTKAMISLIKFKANGHVFFEASGSQLDKLNKYRGVFDEAAHLTLDFTEIKGRDKLDMMIGAFDTTQGIANITAEVTIAGATAPTLAAYVVESGAQAGPYSPILAKTLRYPFSTSVGGRLSIDKLPFGETGGAVIKRIHVEQTNGAVTGISVKLDTNVIHESVTALNEFIAKEHARVPQALWYSIDFIVDGNQGGALDTRGAKSIELLADLSGAENGYIIVEYYDVLGNL